MNIPDRLALIPTIDAQGDPRYRGKIGDREADEYDRSADIRQVLSFLSKWIGRLVASLPHRPFTPIISGAPQLADQPNGARSI